MQADLPALVVFLPLFMAPLCILLSQFGRFAWVLTTIVSWSTAAISTVLFYTVYTTGQPVDYYMGGWPPPIGIEYRIDLLSATFLVLVSYVAAALMPYSFRIVNHEIPRERQPYFYALVLLNLTGFLGIIATFDMFNAYVFLEISALSSYALIAMGKPRAALLSAFQYLVLGTLGASFYLIGIGFIYLMTGTLNMGDLAELLTEMSFNPPLIAGFVFIALGIAIKSAVFPLHTWLPGAYAYAPSSVASFLAAVATKVGIYLFIRLFFSIFHVMNAFHHMHLSEILGGLSILAMLIGSATALYEKDIKRMMAFSTVAQIGCIMLGVSLSTSDGMSAALTYLLNHALVICAIFMAVGCYSLRLHGPVLLVNLHGLSGRMPFTSAALLIALGGLAGMPLTSGFIAKWYLLRATIHSENWLMVAAIAISSFIALLYVGKIINAIYCKPAPESADLIVEAPASMVIPLWIMAGAIIWTGVNTTLTGRLAETIASALLPGGTP